MLPNDLDLIVFYLDKIQRILVNMQNGDDDAELVRECMHKLAVMRIRRWGRQDLDTAGVPDAS